MLKRWSIGPWPPVASHVSVFLAGLFVAGLALRRIGGDALMPASLEVPVHGGLVMLPLEALYLRGPVPESNRRLDLAVAMVSLESPSASCLVRDIRGLSGMLRRHGLQVQGPSKSLSSLLDLLKKHSSARREPTSLVPRIVPVPTRSGDGATSALVESGWSGWQPCALEARVIYGHS